MARTVTPASERLWKRVDKTDTCWLWTGCLDRKGYGIIGDTIGEQKISVRVHRLAYETLVTPLDATDQVDHRCHVRHCVNPSHLRAVTNKQNQENRAGASRRSVSGRRGVYWDSTRKKWTAEVIHAGRKYFLGRFEDMDTAAAVATSKRLELFTHNDLDRAA
jgi:hypothetical protein